MITLRARSRVRGLHVVGQFEIAELGAADDQLLLLGGQRVPRGEVVQILLNDHVAATGEGGVLGADQHGLLGCGAFRILGSVDEPEHIAIVEGTKAVDLVHHGRETAKALHQPLGQLEADVEAVGTDVEKQITGCGHRDVARAGELPERVKLGRTRTGPKPIPEGRTDSHHAGELRFGHAEAHRPLESRHVAEHVGDIGFGSGRHDQNQEYCRLGRVAQNRLRLGSGHDRLGTYATVSRGGDPGSRIRAHEPDVWPATRRLRLLVDAEAAARVDRDIRLRAGRQKGAGLLGARPGQSGLDQRPSDAASVQFGRHRDRVQLP